MLIMYLLIHRSGKTYLAPDRATFNTEYGLVELKEGVVESSTGEKFLITRPWFVDRWMRIRRGPQISHWKDLGLLVSLTGLGSGWKVLEVGTGSGFSTLFFANIVGEKGLVVSYEKNPRHWRIAEENISKFSFSNIKLFKGDIKENPPEDSFDLAFLDIPDPWSVLSIVREHLLPGGFLSSYLPTVEQVHKLESSLLEEGFSEPTVHEVLYREWKLGGRTRPLSSGILHTAFLVLSRKMEE